jgi:hypothetical protein
VHQQVQVQQAKHERGQTRTPTTKCIVKGTNTGVKNKTRRPNTTYLAKKVVTYEERDGCA